VKLFKSVALVVAIGGAVYFLDPQNGKRRRRTALDRAAGLVRKSSRRAERAGRAVESEAYGLKQKATHLREEEKPQPDDTTLARKVESEIFRDPSVPKGQINVNAENGVVYLRGQVDRADLIQELEQAVRKVQGVRGVENLLHAQGAPPQMTY
jgi:osmotically-inducible protein OsmY